MADVWEVWDDINCRKFRSFAAAERHAHRRVAASASERFAISVEITLNMHTVASVRLDGLNRVWTDVADTTLL
jgi:hypothetical protein